MKDYDDYPQRPKADKYQLVSYLTGLLSIMESKESAGRPRGQLLGREYERAYGELHDLIEKEEADERKAEYRSGTSEPSLRRGGELHEARSLPADQGRRDEGASRDGSR